MMMIPIYLDAKLLIYLVAEVIDQSCFANIDSHCYENIMISFFHRLHGKCIYHGNVIDFCQRLCLDHCTHFAEKFFCGNTCVNDFLSEFYGSGQTESSLSLFIA